MRRLLPFLLLLFTLTPAHAESEYLYTTQQSKEIAKTLDTAEHELKRGEPDTDLMGAWLKRASGFRADAGLCVSAAEAQITKTGSDLSTLGPRVKGEDSAVTRKRADLTRQKSSLEKQLASCRLLVLRSEDILNLITERQQEMLAAHLLARGPSIGRLLKENWEKQGEWVQATREFIILHSGLGQLTAWGWATLALVLLGATWLGLSLRRYLLAWLDRQPAAKTFAGYFQRAAAAVSARYAPRLAVSFGAAVHLYLFSSDLSPIPFISLVAYGLPFYFLLAYLVRLFLAPPPPAESFIDIEPKVRRALARRLKVLALLSLLGYLLFSALLWQSLPEPALLLARGVFAAFLVLNLVWVIWLFGRLPRLEHLTWLRIGVTLLLLVTLGAEWLGYRNLSFFILRGIVGSLLVIGLVMLVSRLFQELYEGLDTGQRGWHQRVRHLLGLGATAHFPGLTWLRFLTGLALWSALALVMLRMWGLSAGDLEHLRSYFTDGFAVGSLKVIPARILLALLILAVLLPFSRWLRTRLDKRWLKKTYMERGAREAMVTISGYAVVATAILLALGVAGVDFSSLAIIAGALSVGIGFGLQNIVNNFVSGLILLFERPVKTGDWIVVGNTEGYVRRISIRSTQIQTFDRADVIVPNSELIQNQVTNWMLRDPSGRVVVPVGVAYGTNTQLVKELLLQIAADHPQVVAAGRLPAPAVLFRGFGDSSLDFELRCFIANIDNRLSVISDLNFAIDAAFRQHGIEIPFPQRDLHVRSWAEPSEEPPPSDSGA